MSERCQLTKLALPIFFSSGEKVCDCLRDALLLGKKQLNDKSKKLHWGTEGCNSKDVPLRAHVYQRFLQNNHYNHMQNKRRILIFKIFIYLFGCALVS